MCDSLKCYENMKKLNYILGPRAKILALVN